MQLTRYFPFFMGILSLILFRIAIGCQINFSHEDYHQIYLIGLEYATTLNWPYWGPDIVWSKTRTPGAMQGLLAGIPLQLTSTPIAPIILSNLISSAGLILLGVYAKRRFQKLRPGFIFAILFLLPFNLYNGSVLLNTSYLLLPGAVLFICTAELFIYRSQRLLQKVHWYYFAIGVSMLFTLQLHLSWLFFIPFSIGLLFWEGIKKSKEFPKIILALLAGCAVSGITLAPTLIHHTEAIFTNASGNSSFQFKRLLEAPDLIMRYTTFATLDITEKHKIFKVAVHKLPFLNIGILLLKALAIGQIIFISYGTYKMRKNSALKRSFVLFGLTALMALAVYMLSNKHLSIRTYILLYPIPIWISFFIYEKYCRQKLFYPIAISMLAIVCLTFTGIAIGNYDSPHSFSHHKQKIKQALKTKDIKVFGQRRKTLMDD